MAQQANQVGAPIQAFPVQSTPANPPSGIATGFYGTDGKYHVVDSTGADVIAAGSGGTVTSVFTRTGAVIAVSGDYTVGQVTGAAPLASPTFTGTVTLPNIIASGTTSFTAGSIALAAVNGAAPLASPTFTGTATIPTAAITTLSGTPNFSGSPTITGKITTYNNQVTSGVGNPYVAGVIDLTAQTANISAADLVPAAYVTANGRYEIKAYWVVTVPGTTSTLPSLTISWTDGDNSAVQSIVLASSNSSYGGAAITSTTNTTATRGHLSTIIHAKSGVAIQYAMTAYASSGTVMNYALHIVATRLS